VKPYIPYDVVPSAYHLPMATAADGSALPSRMLSVPDWVVDADIPMLPVLFPDAVLQALGSTLIERMPPSKQSAAQKGQGQGQEQEKSQPRQKNLARGSGRSSSTNTGRFIASSVQEVVELITQVLRQDIRGVHQGRGDSSTCTGTSSSEGAVSVPILFSAEGNSSSTASSAVYNCTLDCLDIQFCTTAAGIEIISIVPAR
jgi:hypothetical protein